MKRVFKWLWNVLEIIIVIYVIVVTSCILCRNNFGFTQFGSYTIASVDEVNVNYLSDSKPGNLLVIKNNDNLKKDDLLYYYTPINEEYVIKNGVVNQIIKSNDNALYILDNDEKTSVSDSRILGKDVKEFAFLGSVKDVLESRIGFLLLVLLPIVIVFVYEICKFVISIKQEEKKSGNDNLVVEKDEDVVKNEMVTEENSDKNDEEELEIL